MKPFPSKFLVALSGHFPTCIRQLLKNKYTLLNNPFFCDCQNYIQKTKTTDHYRLLLFWETWHDTTFEYSANGFIRLGCTITSHHLTSLQTSTRQLLQRKRLTVLHLPRSYGWLHSGLLRSLFLRHPQFPHYPRETQTSVPEPGFPQ